jgi:Tol biopolymer transport system component
MQTLLLVIGIGVASLLAVPLAYLAYRSVGKSQHWRFRPGLRRLTTLAGMEQFPSTDRVGRLLAFEAIPLTRFQIRVRDRATGRDRVLEGPGIHARRPRLSIDGRVVAYEAILGCAPRRASRLVVHDLVSGADRILGDAFDHVTSFAISADAGRILLGGSKDGLRKVHLVADASASGRSLVPGDSEETAPVLSADGRRAAFLSSRMAHPARRMAPVVLDLDPEDAGAALHVVEDRDARALAMSADGRFLAWEAAGDGPTLIRVLDVDARRVATLGVGFAPSLAPDGRTVAFDVIDDEHDLVAVDLVAGRRAVVERRSPYPFRASFAPAGRHLLFGSGFYNPLSRTGDSDLFECDLEHPGIAWAAAPIDWRPAELSAGTFAPSTVAPVAPVIPRNSMWCAAYYFRPDGTMKDLADQDGDGIEVYAQRIARTVDRVRALTGSPDVNVVCHCMGGLVVKGALQYWHDGQHGYSGSDGLPTHGKIRQFVTLASPLRGNSLMGVLRVVRALRIPYYRKGFTRQAHDMTRYSDYLARLNLGERFGERALRDVGACYKPAGRDAPPFHRSFTCDSYGMMDGAVTLWSSRCPGLPGSATHLSQDEFALMYETPDGRCSFEGGRKLVHVPEDVIGDFVVEDKSRAITDWIATHLEPDVPILFVHGSFLFRGLPEHCWQVVMRRLAGETADGPGGRVRVDVSPDGVDGFWLLDSNCD